MHGVCDESRDPAELLDEIALLKGRIARLEEEVHHLDRLAHHDALVPLANRRGMIRELEAMIAKHERHGVPAAVLFVDLVAQQLLSGVRSEDCVARVGGDEFCILLDRADEASAVETAARLANMVAADDFLIDGQPVPLSVAIGLTIVQRGDTPADVLARADEAMYRLKPQLSVRLENSGR
jgi:GGDEF domain-containing protein